MITDRVKRITEYLLPIKIKRTVSAENADILLKNYRDQIHIYEPETCILHPGGHIIFDFGKELHGGVRILTRDASKSGKESARIRFGESVGECCAEIGESGATNDHSPRDFNVCIPMYSDLTFGQTGFRFVRIDNISDSDFSFVCVSAAYTHLEEQPTGSFCCNDEEVNRIFDVAVHTLYLNMQNGLWDGIKRDRLVWIGDMHPEVKGVLDLFGAHPLVEKGLAESAEHNPVPAWITGFPAYSVWWLAVLCDYCYRTGRFDFARSQSDYLLSVLKCLDIYATEDGTMDMTKEGGGSEFCRYFLNWETSEEEGRESGLRGLTLWTVKKCSELLKALEMDTSVADNIIRKLSKNSVFQGQSKAVAALYALGYEPKERAKELLEEGGAIGFSTFISSYILSALADMGKGEIGIKAMKEFYGGMLSRGATSFWESYEPNWLEKSGRIDEFTPSDLKDIHCSFGKYCYKGYRLSLCHGWACGPVSFLMERVLGVKFTSPGGKTIKIEPDLMGLKFAKGQIPTAYGVIKISHTLKNNKIVTEYSLPDGVTIG